MQFLAPCKGINRFLPLNLETFDASEETLGRGAFHSHIRPMWQHVYSADLTAFETAVLSEEAHDIPATYLVFLAFTYL